MKIKTSALLTVLTLACTLSSPALAADKPAAPPDQPAQHADYVAHEWGTFTSVQGADGVQMEWNPFQTWDLPDFVYDRNRSDGNQRTPRYAQIASKSAVGRVRQRMETPVIYFYADNDLTVDVTVDFPKGLVTEWFPRVSRFGPYSTTNRAELAASRKSFIRWDDVRILAPETLNDETFLGKLPNDHTGNHYYAARDTHANLVSFTPKGSDKVTPELEKFLFYRGVGYFNAPLTAHLYGNEKMLRISNTGPDELSDVIVFRFHNGEGSFHRVGAIKGKKSKRVNLGKLPEALPASDLQEQVGALIKAGLVAQGLYPQEADAMIETWRDSWLAENGLRVLYILPTAWTDKTLPLKLDPAPSEVARVMVGRAEIITPSMEWELLKSVVRYSEGNEQGRLEQVDAVRELGLGRFAQPTAARLLGTFPSADFTRSTWNLLNEANKPATGNTLAGE